MPKKPGYIAAHWVPALTAREYPIDAFIPPKSSCCNDEIVYYSEQVNQFIALPATYEGMPKYVVWRCRKCNREIDRDNRKEAKNRKGTPKERRFGETQDPVKTALADAPQEVREQARKDLEVYGNAFVVEEDNKYTNIDPIKVVTDGSTIKIVGDKETKAFVCGDMKCIKCGRRTILTICSKCTVKDAGWKKE